MLRLAHNRLTTLEGLGRATQLEVLDISNNAIKDLAGVGGSVKRKSYTGRCVGGGRRIISF